MRAGKRAGGPKEKKEEGMEGENGDEWGREGGRERERG